MEQEVKFCFLIYCSSLTICAERSKQQYENYRCEIGVNNIKNELELEGKTVQSIQATDHEVTDM